MTLDDLAAYGANVDEGMARCMNNEAFYLRLVGTLAGEKGFDTLAAAIEAHDHDRAGALPRPDVGKTPYRPLPWPLGQGSHAEPAARFRPVWQCLTPTG